MMVIGQMVVGLAFSVGLLILVPIVTMPTLQWKKDSREIASLGLLETIWLTKNDPRFMSARDNIGEVLCPDTDTLRQMSKRKVASQRSGGTEDDLC